jgi:hypothetical protein
MKRLAILALCLSVSAAITVVAAADAIAAPPEIGRCVKVKKGEGHFRDAGCEKGEVKEAGTYNWVPGVIKPKFTSTEGVSFFETVTGTKVVCKASTDSGEYLPPKEDRETIRFTGCEASGIPCTTAGRASGEIETSLLRSVLGFILAPKQVGVDLEALSGGSWAVFDCGPVHIAIVGSVIARVTPISKMTLTFKEKFVQAKGKQKPEKFEGQPKDTLTCIVNEVAEQCGFSSLDTVTNEEKLEINEVL